MVTWDYGEAGRRWPVAVGQVWRVGHHVLGCGDVLASDILSRVLSTAGVTPSRIYSDPPWNAGNVNSFRTKAGVEHSQASFNDFLDRLCARYAESGARNVTVEMGKQNVDRLVTTLARHGFPLQRVDEGTYYHRHPMFYVHAGDRPPRVNLSGTDDEFAPQIVLGDESDLVVLDPCVGRGLTVRAAHQCGLIGLGVELHPQRLSVTIDRLVADDHSLTVSLA